MSSGQTSTDFLRNNNNNTTTTATSTQHNAEPLHNSSRTTPGWFLQQIRGWPWSSWINKITTPRHKHFYKTSTLKKSSPKTPPLHSKTSSSIFSKTSSSQEASASKSINNFTPPVQSLPNFMVFPKYTKQVPPFRPIVSSRGSITYGSKGTLSHHQTLVGQSPHHLKNTQLFIQQLQGIRLQAGESITSYDVKALFTSVPVQPSIQIVKHRLQQDTTLPQRTSMSIPQIISLLEFCLTHTYFLFQGKYYEQVQDAAMGSPISPLIANIFMEEFEVKALQSFPHPLPYGSGLWMTPLSSIRQNTAKTCSSTSTARTHTFSSQRSPYNKDHYHSWTP